MIIYSILTECMQYDEYCSELSFAHISKKSVEKQFETFVESEFEIGMLSDIDKDDWEFEKSPVFFKATSQLNSNYISFEIIESELVNYISKDNWTNINLLNQKNEM